MRYTGMNLYSLDRVKTFAQFATLLFAIGCYVTYGGRRRLVGCDRSPIFSATPLPTVALRSFPGSGNTWTRILLQSSTGILTGSVYTDILLDKGDFIINPVTNSSVVVVKTHFRNIDSHFPSAKRGSILLVRNGTDALLSEFSRLICGHTCTVDNFNRTRFNKYAGSKLNGWFDYYSSIIVDAIKTRQCDLLIVRYELLRMLVFLQQSTARIMCAFDNEGTTNYQRKNHVTLQPEQWNLDFETKIEAVYDLIDRYDDVCKSPHIGAEINDR